MRCGEGELTDSGTRVPLVANWPGKLPPGKVVDDLVDFSDWFPTFVDLAGGSVPAGLDGVSLADRLRGGTASPRPWAFAAGSSARWVRTQQWKLYDDGRLYDMSAGREEVAPLTISGASEEVLRARAELEAALRGLSPAD